MRKALPFVLLLPLIMLLVVSCGKESTSSNQPVLTISVSTISFGSVRSADSLTVGNTGGGTLNWSASPGQIWITVNPNQGSLSAGASVTVTVTIDRDVVPQGGDYSDNISFTSNGGSATVAVSMHKSVLSAAPAQIDFGATYATRQLTLTNESNDTLNWQGSADKTYLGVTPNVGTLYDNGSVNLTVSANRILLVDGIHTGNFYFYAGSESLIVAATLEVTPVLSLSPDSLIMAAPDTEWVFIENDGYGTLDWTASAVTDDGGSWLEVTPAAGVCTHTTADTLTVVVDSSGFTTSDYSGWIIVTTDDGTDSVRVLVVLGEWLYYDDGTYEDGLKLVSPGYLLVRFNDSGDGPATVKRFMIDVAGEPQPIKICGWSSVYSGGYVPGSLLYDPTSQYSTSLGENYFEVSDWDFNGSFFVGYYQIGTLGPYLSADLDGTPALRSYFGDPSQWYYLNDANFAIRAYVTGGGAAAGGERELLPEAVYFLPLEGAELATVEKQKLIRLFER